MVVGYVGVAGTLITVLAPVRNASEAAALFWTLRRQTDRRWALWCTTAAPATLRDFEHHAAPRVAPWQLRTATYARGFTPHQQLTPLIELVATPLVMLLPPGGLLGDNVIANAVTHSLGTSYLRVSPTDSDHGRPLNLNDMTIDELARTVLWVSAATLRRAWTSDPLETLQRLRETTTLTAIPYESGAVSCVT